MSLSPRALIVCLVMLGVGAAVAPPSPMDARTTLDEPGGESIHPAASGVVEEVRIERRPPKTVAPLSSSRATTSTRPKANRGDIFRGLGAWVDIYDLDVLNPARTVARMKEAGVRTLYLETGTSRSKQAIITEAGAWLVAAHLAKISVVGWYLPSYANMDRDLRRSLAVARFRYKGHRFDGLGIDIEDRQGTKSVRTFNARVASHMRAVRHRLGAAYPLAAIPPPPLQMRVAPAHWRGFPWKKIGAQVDAVLLMAYWSDRSGCPTIRRHCAGGYTAGNVRLTRKLVARRSVVVHIIGGVGDSITGKQLLAFVRAAKAAKADGASIYDVVTTKPTWWKALSTLRSLR